MHPLKVMHEPSHCKKTHLHIKARPMECSNCGYWGFDSRGHCWNCGTHRDPLCPRCQLPANGPGIGVFEGIAVTCHEESHDMIVEDSVDWRAPITTPTAEPISIKLGEIEGDVTYEGLPPDCVLRDGKKIRRRHDLKVYAYCYSWGATNTCSAPSRQLALDLCADALDGDGPRALAVHRKFCRLVVDVLPDRWILDRSQVLEVITAIEESMKPGEVWR